MIKIKIAEIVPTMLEGVTVSVKEMSLAQA